MKFAKFILIGSFVGLAFTGFSQFVVFRQTDADRAYETVKYGENRKRYTWVSVNVLGVDIATGEMDAKNRFAGYLALNYNQKYKLNGTWSYGIGVGVHRQTYRLNSKGLQDVGHTNWEKGKLNYWGFNANHFWRINFDPKRGNNLGTYLDLGLFGQLNFYHRMVFSTGDFSQKITPDEYAERFAIGTELRLGRGTSSIYVRHKVLQGNFNFTKMLTVHSGLELSKWSIGLNLGIGIKKR
ncbi:MAG: hypothetical protein LBU91_05895 [Bacteroidales bacterium]|jgi:hypothetical protein|nr:hypothetical protein [Bacteroidales bacterium]